MSRGIRCFSLYRDYEISSSDYKFNTKSRVDNCKKYNSICSLMGIVYLGGGFSDDCLNCVCSNYDEDFTLQVYTPARCFRRILGAK